MSRFKTCLGLSLPFLLQVVTYAYPSGAPPRKTGAPGDQTCLSCHTGTLFSNSTAINVQFPGGKTYVPGVKQRLTITAQDSFADHFGFELTARLASDLTNGQAGDLQPADSSVAFTECDVTGGAPPCSSTAPVEFVTHSTPSTTGTWQVDWTPPSTNVGSVTMYLAVNASADPSEFNKHIHIQNFTLTPQAATPACPTTSTIPVVCGVVNGASFQSAIAPGSWFTITGLDLSSTSPGRGWTTADFTNSGTELPLSLDGTSVTVNGKAAYVEFISPTQVNVITPADASAAGQMVPVVVSVNGTASAQFQVQLNALSPAFFTEFPGTSDNAKYVIAQHGSDFSRVGKPGLFPTAPTLTTPAKAGETVILYGTGFGATTPGAPDGELVSQVSALSKPPVVTIGGTTATVSFAGLVPPFAALYQFNVVIPEGLPSGDAALTADCGNGVTTVTESITLQ